MDHAEARELLEIAAAEPGGIDRLVAGDTPEAAAVAGHLAGCPDCTDEFARLRRASAVIREVVRTTAPPELRARTLAFVAAVGRERSPATAALSASAPPEPAALAEGGTTGRRRLSRLVPWAAAIAAVLVAAVAGTAALVVSDRDAALREQASVVDALVDVTTASLRIGGEADVQRVALAATAGGDANGTVVFSPHTQELLVVTSGLSAPVAGKEYRCWVESGGVRSRVGKMFFGGGLAYWAGPVDALAALEPGSQFGITLVDVASDTPEGAPVLVGEA
jgi:hypothetical protein